MHKNAFRFHALFNPHRNNGFAEVSS